MFEVDGGRSVAIQPMSPAASAFGREASAVLAENLDDLLGEQLLPLRARTPGADEPHLLAVDAAGQPVVVEIVPVLDRAACLRALSYAGRAARMSTQDLAQAYRGGSERFAAHLQAFRETVPATSLLSTTVRPGSRLLLVCAEIADDVSDALEFILQPGWQVQLLRVGVVRGDDGRRIVDVSPLTRRPPARREVEPTPLRLVPREPAPAPVPAAGPAVRTSALAQVRPFPSTPSGGTAAVAAAAGEHVGLRPRPREEPAPRPAPVIVPPPFARAVVSPAQPPTPTHAVPTSTVATPAVASSVVARPPDPDLRLLEAVQEAGEPLPLVWYRPRRDQLLTATIRRDGLVETSDGVVTADPDEAAARAIGSDGPVDGWRVWRLGGVDGPTLADVFEL